jgi:hypothetical protein
MLVATRDVKKAENKMNEELGDIFEWLIFAKIN